jgi:hypothetical protein
MNSLITFLQSRPPFEAPYWKKATALFLASIVYFTFLQVAVQSYFTHYHIFETYSNLKKAKSENQWNSRVVSTIHAVMATWFAIQCFVQHPELWNDIFHAYHRDFTWTLCFTGGYLLTDLRYVFQDRDVYMMIHHIVGAIGLYSSAIR